MLGGVAWGTEKVLEETLKIVKDANISLELLPVWYDVDLPEDLKFLKTHLALIALSGLDESVNTKKFIDKLSF